MRQVCCMIWTCVYRSQTLRLPFDRWKGGPDHPSAGGLHSALFHCGATSDSTSLPDDYLPAALASPFDVQQCQQTHCLSTTDPLQQSSVHPFRTFRSALQPHLPVDFQPLLTPYVSSAFASRTFCVPRRDTMRKLSLLSRVPAQRLSMEPCQVSGGYLILCQCPACCSFRWKVEICFNFNFISFSNSYGMSLKRLVFSPALHLMLRCAGLNAEFWASSFELNSS